MFHLSQDSFTAIEWVSIVIGQIPSVQLDPFLSLLLVQYNLLKNLIYHIENYIINIIITMILTTSVLN